jgi:hypothetical protein
VRLVPVLVLINVITLHGDIRRAHIAPSVHLSVSGTPVYLIDKYLYSQILSSQRHRMPSRRPQNEQ